MAVAESRDLERDLTVSFGAFMEAFGAAQDAGLDAGAIITANLRSTLGEDAWAELPISVKMLLG